MMVHALQQLLFQIMQSATNYVEVTAVALVLRGYTKIEKQVQIYPPQRPRTAGGFRVCRPLLGD